MPTATTATSCVSSTFAINSVADATALADCSSLVGDVLLDPSIPNIDISGSTHISGDLILENSGATISLSTTSLTTIKGVLVLRNITLLSTLEMPALTSVGSIQFQTLPALNFLNFTNGITTDDSISIIDTFLQSVYGIRSTSVGELNITGNYRLINFDLQIRNVTEKLTVQMNGGRFRLYLPDLTFVKHLNINHVPSFDVPRLETIEGFAQFDAIFQDSLAFPRLRTIKGPARFININGVTSLTAPALENCGDLIITNSDNLTNISLPALKAINGQLSITNSTMLAVLKLLMVSKT